MLNLHLHIIDCIATHHLQSDGLPSQGLDKNLHSSMKPEH
uniref:Uncharacterized protein n=1 Tax=Manihot esculenta TaxID=3983 RepID=A0A2C9W917_MANES